MNTKSKARAGAFLAAIAAALTLSLALAGGAAATPSYEGFKMAKFKVEIEGRSNTSWKNNLDAANDCESSDHSYGGERLSFATKKPFVITATYFPDDLNPDIFSGSSSLGVPVVARVNRRNPPAVPSAARHSEDNGGGAEPVRPDCGPRVVPKWHVELEFSDEKRNGLQLHSDNSAKDLYEHCPTLGFTYPFLLDVTDARTEEPLFADLSPDDLFNPKLQKWITIGDGIYGEDDPAYSYVTQVHWTVSFTRLRGK